MSKAEEVLRNALLELEKAKRDLEESRREREIFHEFLEREEAWWDSVKDLPHKELVREISKHHRQSQETPNEASSGLVISFFPMGEA